MSVIVAYIPVLHQGYWQLFAEHPEATELYLIMDEVAAEFTPVHKELRALNQSLILKAIESWDRFEKVVIADKKSLSNLNTKSIHIVIPDELVSTEVATKYFPEATQTKSSIFLRWDKKSATDKKQPTIDATITSDEAAQVFMQTATEEGQKSSDWWRQVGALAVRDSKVLGQTHNVHLPSEQQPYAEGDARAHFHTGDHIELTTAIHAEARLIAEAAATGTSLAEADLYVTDFPCPVCAKSIAFSGIKRVFFNKGYAVLDGERVLKTAGVELIQVLPDPSQS
ncbi:MAG: dCMP deaminase [Patescibacteria group bacterium]|nr:dCMP deaminase [Patescibacteria group bacterium]